MSLDEYKLCLTSSSRGDDVHIVYTSLDEDRHHSYCHLMCRYLEPGSYTEDDEEVCSICLENLKHTAIIDQMTIKDLCILRARGNRAVKLHIEKTEHASGYQPFCCNKVNYTMYDGNFLEDPPWCANCLKRYQGYYKREMKTRFPQPVEKKKKRKKLPEGLRIKIWRRDAGGLEAKVLCPICEDRVMSYPRGFEVGHIESVAKGGSNHPKNLLSICSQCNGDMGDQNMFQYQAVTYPDVAQPVVKDLPVRHLQQPVNSPVQPGDPQVQPGDPQVQPGAPTSLPTLEGVDIAQMISMLQALSTAQHIIVSKKQS